MLKTLGLIRFIRPAFLSVKGMISTEKVILKAPVLNLP